MAPLLTINESSTKSPCSVMLLKCPLAEKAQCIVSFSSDIVTRYVDRLCDIPEAEIKATWYDKDDYKAIKKSIAPTAKKMSKSLALLELDEESRRLEHRTPLRAKRRQKNRFLLIDAVLEE